ncbi:MAG: hypothetical protein BGO38_04440 [Cellulomonas sp. 73-145]|uniref:hypothetical protein n=1 Tax=Cellulomonas sp. 73-145 TaxID=1895739 RepID=UPI000929A48D|nr:hypothetical protein [Cellulomonas sp. 73-145]OJV57148.1 MAG: hypothetical protein BGO38_04440 [Cellulomonas sp. 73-145]
MTSDEQTPAGGAVPDDAAAPVSPSASALPAPVGADAAQAPTVVATGSSAPPAARPRSVVGFWVVGLLVVGLVAVALGGLAALLAGVASSSDWAGLVAVLAGFMVAAGVAGIGWLVLVLVTVRRRLPEGRRTRVTAISVGAVAVTLALGYALSQVSGIGSGASALVVGAVAVVAALLPPELVSREERRVPPGGGTTVDRRA